MRNALSLCKDYLKETVKPGDTVIDATVGNGYDTEFLISLVGETGKVYGFDIQKMAIDNTINRLTDKGINLDNVYLNLASHSEMDKYVDEKIKGVVFNLGYLPKGNHAVMTTPETTIVAIEKALNLITDDGIIAVVIYHGGDSGFHERDELIKYFERLDNKRYSVLTHNFINQINYPPILVVIEKVIKERRS